MSRTTVTNIIYTRQLDRLEKLGEELRGESDRLTAERVDQIGFCVLKCVEAIQDALVAHEPPVVSKEV